MSLTGFRVALCQLLGLLLGLAVSDLNQAQTFPHNAVSQTAHLSAESYRTVECKKEVAAPFTGALLIDSKYDQTDPTKSRFSGNVSKDSKQAQEAIANFTRHLVGFADYYEQAKDEKRRVMALACVHQWMQTWSEADALTSNETTKTGVAVRKWSLAAISSVLIRINALSCNRYNLTPEQHQWLNHLTKKVLDDYQPRQTPDFAFYNNHDYWAGWAVAATGSVLGKHDYVLWGDRVLRRGLQQVVLIENGRYGYLPNELGRRQLAANYMHYALVPLVLLYESAYRNGLPVSAEEENRLQALAAFASAIVLKPESLGGVVKEKQEKVASHKMVWLIPFLSRYPHHEEARTLYRTTSGHIDGYSQVGGRIRPLYPNFKEE